MAVEDNHLRRIRSIVLHHQFAWRAPLADGLNWIAIAQSLPTASVDPQVVSRESIEKSLLPSIEILRIVAVPLFHHGLNRKAVLVCPRCRIWQ